MAVEESWLNKLLKAKMVSLLHDPPYKLWVITAAFAVKDSRVGRVLARKETSERVVGDVYDACRGLVQLAVHGSTRAHELEAWALAVNVLSGIVDSNEVTEFWKVVEHADGLASAFDRWVLPPEAGESGRIVPPEKIVNQLNPVFGLPVSRAPSPEKICAYVRELNAAVQNAYEKGDLTLAYHTLYALLEPLWYITVGGPYASPADTRVPTHTVFDHLYATAMATNCIDPLEPSASHQCSLLYVDLAGVQEWLQAARRTGDMWAASWLASALAWASIVELVGIYGPDIMVLPTARLNPFYLSWLYSKLLERGAKEAVKRLEKVIDKLGLNLVLAREDDKLPYVPRHALMPVTATLILPSHVDPEMAARLVREHYDTGWEKLVEDLKAILPEKAHSLLDRLAKEPPLPIRVAHVTVSSDDKVFRKLVANLGTPFTEKPERLLYAYALSKLGELIERLGRATIRPGVAYSVEATWQAWMNSKRYRECTMCSVRPALPEGSLSVLREEGVVDENEYLCPYCLVKRLMAIGRLPSAYTLVAVGEAATAKPRPPAPPVNVLASLDTFIALCKLAGIECSPDSNDVVDKLRLFEKAYHSVKVPEGCEKPKNFADVLELWFRGARNRDCAVKLVIDTVSQLTSKEVSKEEVEEAFKLSTRYYAIVYADGDSIGDALKGRLGMNEEDTTTYWRKVLEVVKDSEARKRLEELDPATIVAKVVSELGLKGKARTPTTIPTPSYHAALSASLMAAALADSAVVAELGGVVIYSGGDDLVALLPARSLKVFSKLAKATATHPVRLGNRSPWTPYVRIHGLVGIQATSATWVDAVVSSRRGFWGLDTGVSGFYLLGGLMPVAAPAGLGRSYAITLSHYRDPLLLRVRIARVLEKIGKEAAGLRKDVVAVLYGRGGLREEAIGLARNTPHDNTHLGLDVGKAVEAVAAPMTIVASIAYSVLTNKNATSPPRPPVVFTTSLVPDLTAMVSKLPHIVEKHNAILLEMLLRKVFTRNIDYGEEGKAEEAAIMLLEAAKYWPKGILEGTNGLVKILQSIISASR